MIDGFNHLVLVTNDMEKTARFYCDLLGFSIKATVGNTAKEGGLNFKGQLAPVGDDWTRIYFFGIGERDMLGVLEVPDVDTTADPSHFPALWPEEGTRTSVRPQKLDHLAFNVADLGRLEALQRRLRDAGITVSDIASIDGPPFVKSIYFYDPNGVALEVATWDLADPAWAERKTRMFHDPDPIPALRERTA
jgi:catechol 2,3-dioxygenase-like lactoylglutathione lyase family enzyme